MNSKLLSILKNLRVRLWFWHDPWWEWNEQEQRIVFSSPPPKGVQVNYVGSDDQVYVGGRLVYRLAPIVQQGEEGR